MLPADNRLSKVRDFNLLMKHGFWINGAFMDMKVLNLAKISAFFPKKEKPDKFEKQLKIAFTVGVKTAKKAVNRNRTRRQMREVVRLLLKQEAVREGNYLLFVARKNILQKNYAEISDEIKLLLNRAKVFISPAAAGPEPDKKPAIPM